MVSGWLYRRGTEKCTCGLTRKKSQMPIPGGLHNGVAVSLGVVVFGTILHIAGIATPAWTSFDVLGRQFYYSLWQICFAHSCEAHQADNTKACEAMAIIGMIVSFVAIATAGVDIFHKVKGRTPAVPYYIICTLSAVLSFLFILTGIVVWAADVIPKRIAGASSYALSIGYSFFMSIIGGIVILIGGIMYGCYRKRSEARVG